MKNLTIITLIAVVIGIGFYSCDKESPFTGRGGPVKKLRAYAEKQIKDFNQSTSKDRRITDGPPADRTISGMDGLRVD